MPGNNSIRILRGNNVKSSSASNEVLLAGQPLYDLSSGYLYVGDGEANIRTIQAINAQYANNAGTASSSSYATYSGRVSSNLVINSGASSVNYIGNVSRTIYAPTSLGTSGQVWGMVSSTRAGWVNQAKIPSTISNANYANFAGNLTDGDKTINGNLKVMSNLNVVGGHSLDYIHINGSTIHGGPQPIFINSENNNSHFTVSNSSITMVTTCTTGGLTLYSAGNANATFGNGIDILSGGGIDINSNSASIVANRISMTSPYISFSTMPNVGGIAINNRANIAGRVEYNLYFNGSYLLSSGSRSTYNTAWDGSTNDVIYVPTRVGDKNQVWGMATSTQAGWINSPGLTYEGFIDSNGYYINGKRVLAVCIYGLDAYIRRGATNVITGIKGPVVSIDATRGGDSSVMYTEDSGRTTFKTFNASSSYFNAPGGTRWAIFTYSSI